MTTSPFFTPNESKTLAALSERFLISAKVNDLIISESSVQSKAIFSGWSFAHSSTTSYAKLKSTGTLQL
jgi:hypothetical protein